MKFRKLRIAWLVFFSVLCVVVIALWVRSYHWMDSGRLIFAVRTLSLNSSVGRLAVGSLIGDGTIDVELHTAPQNERNPNIKWMYEDSRGFVFFNYKVVLLILPHWSFVMLCAGLAVVPWLRHLNYRFSLRTLLIVMTAVSVALALIVGLSRR